MKRFLVVFLLWLLGFMGCAQYKHIKDFSFDYDNGIHISDTLDLYAPNLILRKCDKIGPYEVCINDEDSTESIKVESILRNRRSGSPFRGIFEISLHFSDTVITEKFEDYNSSCSKEGIAVGLFLLPKLRKKELRSVPIEI